MKSYSQRCIVAIILTLIGQLTSSQNDLIGIIDYTNGELTSNSVKNVDDWIGGWRLGSNNKVVASGDFNGDGIDDIIITSAWGIGILTYKNSRWEALLVRPNGTWFGGWNYQSHDNNINGVGDFNGDGKDDFVVTSGWGIGLLTLQGDNLSALMTKPKDTWFNKWRYDASVNTCKDKIQYVADYDNDGKDEILLTSSWGIGILELRNNSLYSILAKPNGTWFGGWNFQSHDNNINGVGDFNGDGKDDFVVTSGWGIGLLILQGDNLSALMTKPKDTWFSKWRYDASVNTGKDKIQYVADYDNDGKDEILLTSSWGIGILELRNNSLYSILAKPNGTWFGGWNFQSHDNNINGVGDFNGDGKDDFIVTSDWGIGLLTFQGGNLSALMTKPKGTWFNEWRYNSNDKISAIANFSPDKSSEILIQYKNELTGIVDMHTHLMSHLGFGKKAMHGAPDIDAIVPAGTSGDFKSDKRASSIQEALGSCNPTHGGWGLDNGSGNYVRALIINKALDKDFIHQSNNVHGDHHHPGYPDFKYWPHQTSILHQQMWVDWLQRAFEGGINVIVALTVNNEMLAELIIGDKPYDDKTVADLQIDETIGFANRHDWIEIAYSAQDLRRIVSNGKLAIILGMEVDDLGNFNKLSSVTYESVRNEINRLFDKGIRYIFQFT